MIKGLFNSKALLYTTYERNMNGVIKPLMTQMYSMRELSLIELQIPLGDKKQISRGGDDG